MSEFNIFPSRCYIWDVLVERMAKDGLEMPIENMYNDAFY